MNIPLGEVVALVIISIFVLGVLVFMQKDITADIRNDIIVEDEDDDFLR